MYWMLKHVRANINFSRKTVRNNHAITECLMLYIGGLFFPFFPESAEWKSSGKKWFEQEICYQVYEDGTFLQFSHNYHRVLVQLMTWGFYLAEANGEKFTPLVYDRAKKSLNYLFQCQAGEGGELPNYGANDGALFFKLNDADYRNYRPTLNALYYFFNNKHLYSDVFSLEDANWYKANRKFEQKAPFKLQKQDINEFPQGGIYLMQTNEIFVFIKCASYKDRPSQADNMHIDVWQNGINVLRDAGSYKYNTTPDLVNFFNGTKSHNTVMLGNVDQMHKGPRFIWLNWDKNAKGCISNNDDVLDFEGTVKVYGHLSKEITHKRNVKLFSTTQTIEIWDEIKHDTSHSFNLRYHFAKPPKSILVIDKNGVHLPPKNESNWFSSYYGQKSATQTHLYQTDKTFTKTSISF
jgi:hypothetical protein